MMNKKAQVEKALSFPILIWVFMVMVIFVVLAAAISLNSPDNSIVDKMDNLAETDKAIFDYTMKRYLLYENSTIGYQELGASLISEVDRKIPTEEFCLVLEDIYIDDYKNCIATVKTGLNTYGTQNTCEPKSYTKLKAEGFINPPVQMIQYKQQSGKISEFRYYFGKCIYQN